MFICLIFINDLLNKFFSIKYSITLYSSAPNLEFLFKFENKYIKFKIFKAPSLSISKIEKLVIECFYFSSSLTYGFRPSTNLANVIFDWSKPFAKYKYNILPKNSSSTPITNLIFYLKFLSVRTAIPSISESGQI